MSVIDLSQNNKLIQHAERELALAGLTNNSNPDSARLANYVLSIIRLMSTQKHTPESAEKVLDVVRALAMFQILSPLTANPGEWMPEKDGKRHSRRYPPAYLDQNGEAWNDGAIVWSSKNGKWFTGELPTGETSKQPLKLPCYPQVVQIEINEDGQTITHPEHYQQVVDFFKGKLEPEE